MAKNKTECDFSVEAQFDETDDGSSIYIGIKTKNVGEGSTTGIYMFSAKKRHAMFFRDLADKLDALP